MATIIDRPEQKQEASPAPNKFDIFANELTALCRKHGILVEGAVAYAAIPEDLLYHYHCENSGELIRVG